MSAAGGGEHFSLVWNTFPRNLSSGLYSLLTGEQLVDVTLAAEGRILRAHKLILSVCSSYFRELFKGNTCKHPIVILKDVNYRDLSAMLQFMYQGEVSIKQEDIGSFLKVAEILKIKGLTRTCDDDDDVEKNLAEALPLIQHERPNNNAPASQSIPSDSFCEPTKVWSSSSPCPCTSSKITPKEELSIRSSFSESSDTLIAETSLNHPDARDIAPAVDDVEDEEPLDCSSAAPEDVQMKQQQQQQQQQQQHEFPEYKVDISLVNPEMRHLTPEVECIQRPALVTAGATVVPHSEQENMDTMLNAQQILPHGLTAPTGHCQGDSVGFYDTGTMCTSGDFSHDSTAGCSNSGPSKGRRTVKGLPGSSLSLETTLRVISELGPTIRMERGKVIRMYSCPWCLRHFTRKENLKLHVRYIHGPLESLTCKLCGNKYKNSNSLRVHSYLYHNAQRNSKAPTAASAGGGGNAAAPGPGTNEHKPSIVGGNA